ncbi:hypothetical protein [Nocardioides sp. TF02-7]|uniref:hypothetical protein n=1 Tax=Nocardioides sp. TF02-7 TaxID=2917724 RepID=UPI001F06DC9E|nr:hypothetical protein [Nocardioides sp. TF02-7]UMG92819.1 hypothetical protein MF408_24630 [Nocardioides sp. TF02-7]
MLAVLVAGGWTAWYVLTPEDLPVTARTAEATGVVGTPVYVGMLTLDADRTLHVSEVEVAVDGDVVAEPVLCRGGSVGVTTAPEGYCTHVTDGATGELDAGDSVMLRITATEPAEATVGRLELTFREGIRWGTREAGIAAVNVVIVERDTPPPLPPDEEGAP